jgi:hypothetical protein
MEKPKMTTEILANEIKLKEKSLLFDPNKVTRRGDTNNPILIRDLTRLHSLSFGIVKKDSLAAMVNNTRLWFSEDRIRISPKCKFLIENLRSGIWDSTERKDFCRTTTLGHCDGIAALMYLLRSVDQQTNPIPKEFYYDNNTFVPQHIKEQREDSTPAVEAFEQLNTALEEEYKKGVLGD